MKTPRVARMDGGWNSIARDLDRAMILSLFSSIEHLLIGHARELSWSRSRALKTEAMPFRINITALAEIAKLRRSSVARSHRDLVSAGVFRKLEDGSFLINKDYREWKDREGNPRLTVDQIAWCMEVTKTLRTEVKATTEPTAMSQNCDNTYLKNETSEGVHLSQNCDTPVSKMRHPCLKNETSNETPPRTPLEERTAFRVKKSEEEKSAALFAFADIPPFPSEPGPLMVSPGKHTHTQAQAHEIWALLWRSFKNQRLSNGWYEHQQWYPFDRWMIAIRVAVRRGKSPESVAYLERIAGDESQSGEDKPPARTARPAEPQPPYLQEAPWRDLGYYRFKGWPVPKDHPQYAEHIAETLRNGSGLPHNASPDPPT